MSSTTADRPLVAHRYTAVLEIEDGSIVVLPREGRFVVHSTERLDGAVEIHGYRAHLPAEGDHAESVVVPLYDPKFRSSRYPNRLPVEDEFSERELSQIEGYADGLLSGQIFTNVARSHRSAIGYRPPSNTRSYAQALVALGKGATNDRQATLVAAAAKALTPHAHGPEATLAYVYEAVAAELRRGWFDTIGNAAPDAGRRSSHEHEYTLRDRLEILATLERASAAYPCGSLPGLGWCAEALCRREGIRTEIER